MKARLRQDAIIRSLRRTGISTIPDLAESVGASRRTVLRDIGALRDEGFVIHSEPGRGGGLQLDAQSVQTTTRLSVAEVFALLISVASMRAAGNLPFAGIADAGLAKIEKALPQDKLRDLRRFLGCLFVGQLAPDVDVSTLGTLDGALLPAFETAFLERRYLRFCYRDAKGVVTERRVEPQAMLILPPLCYLVAWDPAREAFRHFRMDRIRAPGIDGDGVFRRRHVSFDDHVRPVRNISR
jgi:predicted DNA-binding transcriptional regulator YafY